MARSGVIAALFLLSAGLVLGPATLAKDLADTDSPCSGLTSNCSITLKVCDEGDLCESPCPEGSQRILLGDFVACLTQGVGLQPCPTGHSGQVVSGVQVCARDGDLCGFGSDALECIDACEEAETGAFAGREAGCPAICAESTGDADCLTGIRQMVDIGGVPVGLALPNEASGTESRRIDCPGENAHRRDTFVECAIAKTSVHRYGYYYLINQQNGATHVSFSHDTEGRWWYEDFKNGKLMKGCAGSGHDGKGWTASLLYAGVSEDTAVGWLGMNDCRTGPAYGITRSWIDAK
jgi:hypothetical protein